MVLDFLDEGRLPVARISLFFGQSVIHWAEIFAIFGDALLSVQVDGFERPHEEPPQTKTVGDRLIDIAGVADAVFDQPEGLRKHCALQSVDDEAIDLAR